MKQLLLAVFFLININAICQQSSYECINHYQMLVFDYSETSLSTRQALDATYLDTININNWNNVTYVTTGPSSVSSSTKFDCMSYSILIRTFGRDTSQIDGAIYL